MRPLAGLAVLLGVRTAGRDAPGPLTVASGSRGVSGITHDSRRVRPGDLYAALPGSTHHGARFCAQAAAAGAAAVLTDPAGKELAIRAGLPVFVVGDPRARLGEVASWIYGHPSEKLTADRRDRDQRQDHHDVPAGVRAAGGGPPDRPDRRRADPDRRRQSPTAS